MLNIVERLQLTIFLALDAIFDVQINFSPFLRFSSLTFFLEVLLKLNELGVGKSNPKKKKKNGYILGLRTKRIIINVSFHFLCGLFATKLTLWLQPKRHNNRDVKIKMYNNALAQRVSVNSNIEHCWRPLTTFFGELIPAKKNK